MAASNTSDVSLGAITSAYVMQLAERTGGVIASSVKTPTEAATEVTTIDTVNISAEGKQKLAETLRNDVESNDSDNKKAEQDEDKSNEYTAELERFIKQLQRQIKAIQEQIQSIQEDQSLDDEAKQTMLEQQYMQLSSTQAMLLEAVDNLIEAKRKFKEEVKLDMNSDD